MRQTIDGSKTAAKSSALPYELVTAKLYYGVYLIGQATSFKMLVGCRDEE